MGRNKLPYLPLYVADFMTDEKLVLCSAESVGVYIWLMCILHKSEDYGVLTLKAKDKQTSWQNSSKEPSKISEFAIRLCKQMPFSVDVIERSLEELVDEGVITLDGDRLYQKRMVKDGKTSENRAISGQKGGSQKAASQRSKQNSSKQAGKTLANSLANEMAKSWQNTEIENEIEIENESEYETETESESVSESVSESEDVVSRLAVGKKSRVKQESKQGQNSEKREPVEWKKPEKNAEFETFWEAYPKKTGKLEALQEFKAAQCDLGTMLAAINAQKQSRQWQEDNGKFIPAPAKWLREGRWLDRTEEARTQPDRWMAAYERLKAKGVVHDDD